MRELTVIRTEKIECPECYTVQEANVTYRDGDPFPAFIHHCEKCHHIIMESEWQLADEVK